MIQLFVYYFSCEVDLSLLNQFEKPLNTNLEEVLLPKFPEMRTLSCGYEHAAVIRNGGVYTMGMANSGCLGIGPMLPQSTCPVLVETLVKLKVKALSVSCGKRHTLVLTDNGVS